METTVKLRTGPVRLLWQALLALLCWCASAGGAMAGIAVNSVNVNGQGSVVVLNGAAITVNTNVSLTSGTDWQSTRITTSPASSLSLCSETPNIAVNGSYNQGFAVNAPAVKGTYTLVVQAYSLPGCLGTSASRNLASGIRTDTAPVVLSITRINATPTTQSPVSWTLTFDREVDGVTLDDFEFANSGVTGLSLSGTYFTNDTSVYTMVTTNTGSGTLGLNLVDNGSIVDLFGLPLGGAGPDNGDFTGQVYVIDRAGPTFPSVAISSNNATSAAFVRNGEVVTVAFTIADANSFTTPTATINGVTATVTGSGNNWVATRTMGASDAEGLVSFRLDTRDSLNNAATPRTTVTNGSSVTLDRTAPVASISCASACGTGNPVAVGQVSWTVTFSEAVTGLSTANFTLSGSAAAGASIASLSGGPNVYTLLANAGSAGLLGLNLSQSLTTIRDRAGNTPAANSATAANSYTIGGCSVAAGGGCTFDAVETGGAINSTLLTKRSATTVTLDILALNGAVLNTSSNDAVVATLVLASGSACSGTAVSNDVAFSFLPANGGRRSVSFSPTRAAPDVRVRLVSSGITACSRDNFTLRPDALSVSSSNANADASGSNAAAATVFKAGSGAFQLQAASALGYSGTPKLAQPRLQSSGAAVGTLAGVFGAADAATGAATGTAFTYGEVGYVRLNTWSVYDDGSFASVDSAKGECFSDAALGTANAPADPNVANGAGRIGCYFGSAQSAWFGRFIPDHFAMSAAGIVNRSATATCSASPFTYMGETLTASFVLTAQNFQNITTANYTGSYARLAIPTQLGTGAIDDPVGGPRRPLAACAATPVGPCLLLGTPAGSISNGVSTTISAPLSVVRASTTVAPYTAFKIGVMPTDADGVRLAAYNLDTVNVTAGASQRALVGSTAVRYGRMQIDNAYGSELLNLSVKVAAQYWNGTSYTASIQDSCTPLGATGFSVSGQSGGITAANMDASHLVAGTAMSNGAGRVVLTKPTPAPANRGRALLQSVNPALPGSARVSFGVYKSGPVIYVREIY
jgi:hypothetical protein